MSENIDQAIRDIVRGASVVYVGLILQSGISFLAQVIAARFLTTSGFGGIVVGTALIDVGSIIASLGLAEGLIRYLPRTDDEKAGGIITTTLLISFVASSILAFIVVTSAGFLANDVFGDPSIRISIIIFGAAIPFATLLFVAIGGIRARKVARYRVYAHNIVQPTLRFAFIATAVAFGLGQAGIASGYALPYVFTSLFATWLLYRTLPSADLGSVSREILPSGMFRYSLPFIVNSMASFIYRSADIFILLYFIGSGAVGTYGVAYASARLILLFSSALGFLGAPVASELEDSEGISAVLEVQFTAVRWLTILSVPVLVPLVVFAPEFITIIYRPRYVPGSTALAVLAVGFAVHNLFSVQANVFRAVGSSRELAVVSSISAIANVVLNLLLIPVYGLLGAAVATVVAYLIRDLLMFAYVYFTFGEAPVTWKVIPPIILSTPLFAGLMYARSLVPTSLAALVGVSAGFTGFYLLLVLVALGLDPKEVMLIRSIEERFDLKIPGSDWIIGRFS